MRLGLISCLWGENAHGGVMTWVGMCVVACGSLLHAFACVFMCV